MGAEENLTHILFDLSDSEIGFNSAQLDELIRRMAALKAKGKKTIAWLEDAGNMQLAIAACCDEIIMALFGGVDMPSAALETMFYRDAMDLDPSMASTISSSGNAAANPPIPAKHDLRVVTRSYFLSQLSLL